MFFILFVFFFNSLERKGGWEFSAVKAHFLLCLGGCSSPPLLPRQTDQPLPAKTPEQGEGRGFSAPLLKVFCLRGKQSLARGLKASKPIFPSNIWGSQRGRSLDATSYIKDHCIKKNHKITLKQGTELKIAPCSAHDRQQNGY